MTPERLQLVRASWRLLEPDAAAAAVSFYDKLFEIDPAARALFTATDMSAQRTKLIRMLTAIVDATEDDAKLVGMLAQLGRRHANHDVRDADYDAVGASLLWMLECSLDDRFTPEVRDAWAEIYRLIAGIMRRAGDRERAERAASASMRSVGGSIPIAKTRGA